MIFPHIFSLSVPAISTFELVGCYVLSSKSLCDGPDPSSRGVLPSVCECVIACDRLSTHTMSR